MHILSVTDTAIITKMWYVLQLRCSMKGSFNPKFAYKKKGETMIQSLLLRFFEGVFGANAIPHFVKGITKEPFPTPFGPSPVINVVAGWGMFVLAGLLGYWTHIEEYPMGAIISIAIGVLLIGIFHAWIGAFGRRSIG